MSDRAPAAGPRGAGEHGRPVAAGGWRRAVLGLAVGGVAGAMLARLLPRAVPPSRGR